MIEYIFTFILYRHNKHFEIGFNVIKMLIGFGINVCHTNIKIIKISINW